MQLIINAQEASVNKYNICKIIQMNIQFAVSKD